MGTLNTSPRTWVAAAALLAAQLNAELRDAFTALQAAWTTYAVTTTGITLGNGTVVGHVNRIGKTIDFSVVFTFGSTSSITASPTFTLPVTSLSQNWSSLDCTAFDTSASAWWPLAAIAQNSATIVSARALNTVAGGNLVVLSSTVPFTWATGDVLTLTGRYEAA